MNAIQKAARAISAHMSIHGPDHEGLARACIASLIPPSQEMVAAMVRALDQGGPNNIGFGTAETMFTAAINQILTEGEKA